MKIQCVDFAVGLKTIYVYGSCKKSIPDMQFVCSCTPKQDTDQVTEKQKDSALLVMKIASWYTVTDNGKVII